jgi:hypothetical protein
MEKSRTPVILNVPLYLGELSSTFNALAKIWKCSRYSSDITTRSIVSAQINKFSKAKTRKKGAKVINAPRVQKKEEPGVR